MLFKKLFKWMRNYRKWNRSRKQSDYRATALAVKLSITGALTPCSSGVKIIPRHERSRRWI